ncbi:hypothetical protein HPB47_006305 [Ixodes persulcatus]|uniref:Uncharacterized protein n=1 Tax=Ixodes persulcatus TaxID=34615 RepID=A0AC60PAM1_IXOPE|nr:hypothetical protein HPB47_006305 [Ixodes persulcatus]
MLNLLDVFWTLVTAAMIAASYLHFTKGDKVPALLTAAFLYGKAAETNRKTLCLKNISIPKRWFKHFYQFGVVFFTGCTMVMVRSYVFGHPLPSWVVGLVDIFVPHRNPSATATSVLLVQVLETCQVFRRCFECMFVCIYSDVRMHVWHYLMGFFFYFGVQLSILSNAPGFSTTVGVMPAFSLAEISWHHIVGTVIFLWGFCVQFDTHLRMASLRKDSEGKVVSLKHDVPKGGMFEYVSCPHYMAEIVVYSALTLVLGSPNPTWWLALAWTWANQVGVAFVSHNWYREQFRNYPRRRKAIFPYLL